MNSEILGAGISDFVDKVWYVDGDNGASTNGGEEPAQSFSLIQTAINSASADDLILVRVRAMAATDTDPVSYAEALTIPAGKSRLKIIGVGNGVAQGALPQVKKGSGSNALLTVRSAGCLVTGLGFNGAGSTGGGILLDDDGGTAKSAFGSVVEQCHFKNCVGSTADNAATGGAVQWAAAGNSWQVRIANNRFYKNVGDVVLIGTSASVPQDVVIDNNQFSGPAASTDCNLYLAGGSGMNGVHVTNNFFPALPALGGTTDRFVDMTGCVGILASNFFAILTAATGTPKTFAAAGTGAFVPTTVFMAGNFGETTTAGESGEVIRT